MRFPRNLFRRKSRDQPSVLDYETTEALASVLAGTPTKSYLPIPNANDDKSVSTSSDFQKPNTKLVVDWKLPVFDSDTTNEQTIDHELQRLIALQSYNLLEMERDAVFDRITSLASEVFETPVAIINLVDLGRTWFVSGHGTGGIDGTSRSESFCAHVVQGKANRPLIVPDLTKDFRFQRFATVIGPPYLRFYAGAPLISSEGYKLGALCIMDVKPRKQGLMDFEEEILVEFADMAMKIMVERRDKMKVYVNEINQESNYFGNSCFDSLESLLGPPLTNVPKLIRSINTLVKPLPRKVPITIDLDTKVPIEIECNDVLLLRATLMLLSHSAGRTESGSIHLRIHYKKKRVVFECEDTGPFVSTKAKHVEQYFNSIPKSSTIAAMVALVRSMDGEYGIYSIPLSSGSSSTVFWFSPHHYTYEGMLKSKINTNDEAVLLTIHSSNQPIGGMTEVVKSKMNDLTIATDPIDIVSDICSFNY